MSNEECLTQQALEAADFEVAAGTTEGVTTIEPLGAPLDGSITVPGDKSISHRAILFSAMAEGTSRVMGVLDSEDVRSSIRCVRQLGAEVSLEKQPDGSLSGGITGWGAKGPKQPDEPLDCGNSGTTARLLMGVLAPWDIRVTLSGDDSLTARPMRRITAPLMKMGARFEPEGREHLPLTEIGNPHLRAIDYVAPMASAQLKTAVLLAGTYAQGTTTLTEPARSRNHTELMLPEYGVPTMASDLIASVEGPHVLQACEVNVPGDPSSAAFLVCAAVLMPGSGIQIENVSLNPARVGFTRTLERMGAQVNVTRMNTYGKEPSGIIEALYTENLKGCEIPSQHIASVIDEIPVLSLVAAHASGVTVFRNVAELRVKETDRLAATIQGLSLLGVDAWEAGDDLFIEGQPGLKIPEGITFDAKGDHRLAMTWAVAGLAAGVPVNIKGFDCVNISYPTFLHDMERLSRQ